MEKRPQATSAPRGVGLALALSVLAGCSGLPLDEPPPTAGPDASSTTLVADNFKASFKDYATYQDYEISDSRPVHSLKGWSWVSCVRFQDRGHVRTVAVFIKDGKVIDTRYAVQTDGCAAQNYARFELTSGAALPASPGLSPIY